MFNKLFKGKKNESTTVIGYRGELIHDATVYQHGTMMIDGVRYSVKIDDGSELIKGTVVEVISKDTRNGTTVLTARKVQ